MTSVLGRRMHLRWLLNVGAIDPTFTETWNIGPARGPLELSLNGDWTVVIDPDASVKAVKQHVEQLIQKLEDRGIHNILVDHCSSGRI